MSNTNITTAVLALEIDTAMLNIMQKLLFTMKRLNPTKEAILSISGNALIVTNGERVVATATKDEELQLWRIVGDAWLSQYVHG